MGVTFIVAEGEGDGVAAVEGVTVGDGVCVACLLGRTEGEVDASGVTAHPQSKIPIRPATVTKLRIFFI